VAQGDQVEEDVAADRISEGVHHVSVTGLCRTLVQDAISPNTPFGLKDVAHYLE
jgi:hypothetical protein